jgi:hypothetical protein
LNPLDHLTQTGIKRASLGQCIQPELQESFKMCCFQLKAHKIKKDSNWGWMAYSKEGGGSRGNLITVVLFEYFEDLL